MKISSAFGKHIPSSSVAKLEWGEFRIDVQSLIQSRRKTKLQPAITQNLCQDFTWAVGSECSLIILDFAFLPRTMLWFSKLRSQDQVQDTCKYKAEWSNLGYKWPPKPSGRIQWELVAAGRAFLEVPGGSSAVLFQRLALKKLRCTVPHLGTELERPDAHSLGPI